MTNSQRWAIWLAIAVVILLAAVLVDGVQGTVIVGYVILHVIMRIGYLVGFVAVTRAIKQRRSPAA